MGIKTMGAERCGYSTVSSACPERSSHRFPFRFAGDIACGDFLLALQVAGCQSVHH